MKKIITSIMLALLPMVSNAYDAKIKGIYYNFSNGEATVTYGGPDSNPSNSYSGDVVIPVTVTFEGVVYKVTCIGGYAFYNCKELTSVIIPEGVTSIGEPEIGKNFTFYNCTSLTKVVIPSSVTSLADGTFYNCTALADIYCYTEEVPSTGNYVFYGVPADATLHVTWMTIDDYKATEPWSGFANIVAEYDYVSNGVYYERHWTCTMVTVIANPFKYAGTVVVPDFVTLNGVDYPVTYIDEEAFNKCRSLTSVTIGNSVTRIGNKAFSECSNLTSVTLGNGVTAIGDDAFSDCSSLTSINIPEGVTSIGDNAFHYCSSLTSIIIPEGVTSIGDDAFSGCGSLTSIKVESGNPEYDSRNDCNAIIKTAANRLLRGCQNTVIPNSVTSICWSAFDNCTGLTSITIPNSVTSIGDNAFSGCISLTSIDIPEGVTRIGEETFSGCRSLTSITIPNSVTRIGEKAFSGCRSLTSIDIPEGVTSIDEETFSGCRSLTSITIPNSVTNIEEAAFSSCGLISVTIPGSVTSIGRYAFSGSSLTSINIPSSVTTISDGVFSRCSDLTSINIPEGVTSIGNSAFSDCTSLKSIIIPDGVTSIGSYAFKDCTRLTEVYCLADNVPETGYKIFHNTLYSFSYISYSTLYVPESAIEQYKTTEPWSGFGTFVGLTQDMIDGVQEIKSEELRMKNEEAWYDLSGRKILNGQPSMVNGKMPKGINIIRYPDGTTKKLMVK